ncbi:DNA internalization-related competence protein ComEC/Rec2 [Vogesella sp. LIG4]|uniref:DNA internalization-related competence protein ComEC/Rec2 n=1 Tax=Vogesella sp. LIG4 TaxID=1192162 RepID=UPI00081F8A8F|nr:DNA internalization-related competence protein ComEC/Rec2 [Vogesella sp. LIG4]SCK17250.1 competence protein ComEC [Vogesella sp. LIG4]
MNMLTAFCLGLVLCVWLPAPPDWHLLLAAVIVAWPLWWRRRTLLLAVLLLGVVYAGWRIELRLAERLPVALEGVPLLLAVLLLGVVYAGWRIELRLAERLPVALEGVPLQIHGTVRGLAATGEFGVRFRLQPDEADRREHGLPPLLELNDYARQDWPPGSRWQLLVRLRQPRGAANVAGFDAARWYWSEAVQATGSVGKHRRALAADCGWQCRLDTLRQAVVTRLASSIGPGRDAALVAALAVGAQQGIARPEWQALAATGLTHAVSVSGLHITLVAGLVLWLVRRLLRPWPRCQPQRLALLASLLGAVAYALLAGFSVPTQRTVWMLAATVAALWQWRSLSGWQVWLAALAVVLLIDPFAVLAAGFWLSFGLVGALIAGESGLRRRPGYWPALLGAQWRATLASLPPLAAMFGQWPLLSPLANALGIPLVSLLLTPLALLAAALPWAWLARLAGWAAAGFWWWVDWLAAGPQWWFPALPWPLLPAALLGTLCLVLPLSRSLRLAGLLLLLPLLLYRAPRPLAGELRVEMIDVGQGLAVLLQTSRHDLLFDTGAGDAGRVLLPVLRALGASAPALMLSHHDADHDGAAAGVLAALPVPQLWRGQPGSVPEHQAQPCRAGQSWVWDGVRFDVLWPRAETSGEDNAHSCVLRVATWRQAILLTGDAPQAVELELLRRYGAALRSQVLVVGHHGSRTSSAEAWLDTVQPQYALISVGYHNRYRHPHPLVLQRLAARALPPWRTDQLGALQLRLGAQIDITPRRQRRYWQPADQAAGR